MLQKNAFSAANVSLYSLTDYPSLIKMALEKDIIAGEQNEVLLNWRTDPANWKGLS